MNLNLQAIGLMRTPYPEKFGVPRQAGLVPEAVGHIELFPDFDKAGIYEGLEGCSHVWLLFHFHLQADAWSPKVRPPRLGGNKKLGVFATRSPRRPNGIGLSALEILSVDCRKNLLQVKAPDLVDGTPVLDIRPYLPYADCLPSANCHWAPGPPKRWPVDFSPDLEEALSSQEELRDLIRQTLSLNPRPSYHQDDRSYGTRIGRHNVRWQVLEETVLVLSVELHES